MVTQRGGTRSDRAPQRPLLRVADAAAPVVAPAGDPRPGPAAPAVARSSGSRPAPREHPAGAPPGSGADDVDLDPDVRAMLRSLRIPAMWLDPEGLVLWAHPTLEAIRLIRRRAVRIPEIERMVEDSRVGGRLLQRDMTVRRPGRRQAGIRLRVRVSPMPSGASLVLVEDISEAERLDHVRRDFVANVSHELKTPIGALSLLAEAVVQGRDDPGAVEHFAHRMILETGRLTTLINDLMDLSRLEGIDPLHPMEPVGVDRVVAQACDDSRMLAQAKGIQFLRGGVPDLRVTGVESQLVTAVRNLIVNAISYSPPWTKVAVTTGLSEGSVTIAVTDQGIGIPPEELERIFERFYRVDPARSRDTGGTGLGLAIVKHVCANHGGDCEVWSRVGEGSTFTIRLPDLGPGGHSTGGRSTSPAKEGQ